MADDLVIKIGDMGFESFDDWLNLDVVNKLPVDPFEMNKCTMIRGYINISDESIGDDKFDDKNGFFLFDELSKKVLHPIKKHDDGGGYKDMGFESFDDWLDFDVVNKLPVDPFEMNVSGGCTMIRGWIHEVDDGDDIGYIKINDKSIRDEKFDDKNGFFLFDELSKKVLHPIKKHDDDDDGDDVGYIEFSDKSIGDEKFVKVLHPLKKHDGDDVNVNDVGVPHDALFLALGHLGIRDLLSVERVCKSFRDGVRDDPLLWRNINIDQPVGESFNDDSLLRITDRAKGSLQSLSLFKCLKITDTGLKNVLQKNLGLIKLNVVGCNGLSMEGLLTNMKSFGGSRIKQLRIGGLHNITTDQFEELNKLLSLNNPNNHGPPKPRFFHGGQLYLSLDDNRPLDIESCPQCQQIRQVYDCPVAGCGGKHNNCKACTFCIPRCTSCGCCFNERDYIETFSLDLLCLDCLTRFLRFPDCEDEDISIRGFHQQASYHFYLYG